MACVSDEQVQNGRFFRIGELARLAGVTPRAVRFYEKQGLLAAPERSDSGYHLYGPQDLVRVIRVRRLRELGMSIERVREVVGDPEGGGRLADALAALAEDLRERAVALEEAAGRAREALAGLSESGDGEVWRWLLAAAERGGSLDDPEVADWVGRASGAVVLARLLADPGWLRRWEPLGVRLRALRDADPEAADVEPLAEAIAELLPRAALPDEAADEAMLKLLVGRRYSAAQARCLYRARRLLDPPGDVGQ
jgi:DNA-binding transcriptional MerR regulator